MIYSGRFKVTSPFGLRKINGQLGDHKGIDVVGITEKNVCSVCDGTVLASQIITDKNNRTWEWGNYVCVLGNDGNRYYYCHLKKRFVSVGDIVKQGDHIGHEGNTGYSFGSHCHFEVRNKNNVSVNPAEFLHIENRTGIYGVDYRSEIKTEVGLSEDTMRFLDKYKYAADFYRKLYEKIKGE